MTDDAIDIVELEARPALAITATAKTLKLGKVMGDAYSRIKARIDEHQLAPDSAPMPFCIYRNLDWERLNQKGLLGIFNMMFVHRWDLEMGMPVARRLDGVEDMHNIDVPAGRYIKAIHMGTYMKVGEAYERIRVFAADQNLAFRDYSIEVYTNDPTTVATKDIRTEVYVPIAN